MRPSLGAAGGQTQQGLDRGTGELLGVIDQQIDFLPSQRQLDDLRHHPVEVGVLDIQRLPDLLQDCAGIGGALRSDDHAHDGLLVAACHQGLAHQRLAASLRPGHDQQELAVARQMMQLPQHRLALGGEELEARHARRKGVVAETVMVQVGIVGRQTGHENPLCVGRWGQRVVIRIQC